LDLISAKQLSGEIYDGKFWHDFGPPAAVFHARFINITWYEVRKMKIKIIGKCADTSHRGRILLVLTSFSILITACTLAQRRLPQSPWMAQIE
jgi:hypothetical protein